MPSPHHCVIVRLLCRSPHYSVFVSLLWHRPLCMSSSPCCVIVPLFCLRPTTVSSSPYRVIIALLSHRPPDVASTTCSCKGPLSKGRYPLPKPRGQPSFLLSPLIVYHLSEQMPSSYRNKSSSFEWWREVCRREDSLVWWSSVQDSIYALAKAHSYALHPLSQTFPQSFLSNGSYLLKRTSYGH